MEKLQLYRAKSLPVSFEPSSSSPSLLNNLNLFKKLQNKQLQERSPINLSQLEKEKRETKNCEQEMRQSKIEEKETYTKITRFEPNTNGFSSRQIESLYNDSVIMKPSLDDKVKSSSIKISAPTGSKCTVNENLLENHSSVLLNRVFQDNRTSRECSPNFSSATRIESLLSPRAKTNRQSKIDYGDSNLRQAILRNKMESNQSPCASFYNIINPTNEQQISLKHKKATKDPYRVIKITEIIEIDTSDDETREYLNSNRLKKSSNLLKSNLKDSNFASNSQSGLNEKLNIFEKNYAQLSPLCMRKKYDKPRGDYIQLPIFFENKSKSIENESDNNLINSQTCTNNNGKSKTEIFLEIIDDSKNENSVKKSEILESSYFNQSINENKNHQFKITNTQNCLRRLKPILSEAIESLSDRELNGDSLSQTPNKAKRITIKITGKTKNSNTESHQDNLSELRDTFDSNFHSSTPIKTNTQNTILKENHTSLVKQLNPMGVVKSDFKPIKEETLNKANHSAKIENFSPLWTISPKNQTRPSGEEKEFNLDSFKSYLKSFDRSVSMPPPIERTKTNPQVLNINKTKTIKPLLLASENESKIFDLFNFNSINDYNPSSNEFSVRNESKKVIPQKTELNKNQEDFSDPPIWTYRDQVTDSSKKNTTSLLQPIESPNRMFDSIKQGKNARSFSCGLFNSNNNKHTKTTREKPGKVNKKKREIKGKDSSGKPAQYLDDSKNMALKKSALKKAVNNYYNDFYTNQNDYFEKKKQLKQKILKANNFNGNEDEYDDEFESDSDYQNEDENDFVNLDEDVSFLNMIEYDESNSNELNFINENRMNDKKSSSNNANLKASVKNVDGKREMHEINKDSANKATNSPKINKNSRRVLFADEVEN